MKVTMEIDCTPDEARQFLGLPDLKPLQAAVMVRIEAQMAEAVDRFSPEALLQAWMPFVPHASKQMSEAFGRFFRSQAEDLRKADG